MCIVKDVQYQARIDKRTVEQLLVPDRDEKCLPARQMMPLAHVLRNDPRWLLLRADPGQCKRRLSACLWWNQTCIHMYHGETLIIGQAAQDLSLLIRGMRQES